MLTYSMHVYGSTTRPGKEACWFLAILEGYVHVFVESVVVFQGQVCISSQLGEESVVHCGYVC